MSPYPLSDLISRSYTASSAEPTAVFPTPTHQALASVLFITATAVLTFLLARRSDGIPLLPTHWPSQVTWARLCVVLVFLDSLAFVFFTSILIFGVGMSTNRTACAMGIFACITFYAGSKILIYLFLAEKAFSVSGSLKPRLQTPVYRFCILLITPYIAVLVLMIVGRIAFIRADGACVIGLGKIASLPLLVYDFIITAILSLLFLVPLMRSTFVSKKLRAVAIRTLYGAVAALITSTVNIAVLTIMHGKQLGWVCLGCCCTDVTLNALVLYLITSPLSNNALGTTAPASPLPKGTSLGISSYRSATAAWDGERRSAGWWVRKGKKGDDEEGAMRPMTLTPIEVNVHTEIVEMCSSPTRPDPSIITTDSPSLMSSTTAAPANLAAPPPVLRFDKALRRFSVLLGERSTV